MKYWCRNCTFLTKYSTCTHPDLPSHGKVEDYSLPPIWCMLTDEQKKRLEVKKSNKTPEELIKELGY